MIAKSVLNYQRKIFKSMRFFISTTNYKKKYKVDTRPLVTVEAERMLYNNKHEGEVNCSSDDRFT